jgi:hypothetical protein
MVGRQVDITGWVESGECRRVGEFLVRDVVTVLDHVFYHPNPNYATFTSTNQIMLAQILTSSA